jgi:hypothetical protein
MFVCGRNRAPRCRQCGSPAVVTCEFPLTGIKKGQFCGLPVCLAHSKSVDGKRLCLCHARYIEKGS